MTEPRPTVVVLTAAAPALPSHLADVSDRIDFRVTDAAGLPGALPGARGLFLWEFDSGDLQRAWSPADSLEWIHVAAAGVDAVLFDELRDSTVTLTNARGIFDRPIAEFVLAGILAHTKRLHESMRLQRRHSWCHLDTLGLSGRRALVVGTGSIGREIARLLRAVGMTVRGAGRSPTDSDPDFGVVVSTLDLASQVGWADDVVNATPLTAGTTGLFAAPVFAAMAEGAHFVNIGRGGSVVEADLLAALESRHLAAASLDVFEAEPLPADSPVWDAPGLVVSAHMSGDVLGWRAALGRQFVDNAERWLAGRPLLNVVDKKLGYVPRDRR